MHSAPHSAAQNEVEQHAIEQHEQWAFLSQLGRIFDAFTELDAITPQSAFSEVEYLFPHCEVRAGSPATLNDIVAQLLLPFFNAEWRNADTLLRRRYTWDDPVMSNFSNRATIAQMRRAAFAESEQRLAA
jgi:hypothetical protein